MNIKTDSEILARYINNFDSVFDYRIDAGKIYLSESDVLMLMHKSKSSSLNIIK